MAASVMCAQVVENGKWHPVDPKTLQTACAQLPRTERRDLDLIDSKDRCRLPACIDFRNKARGLS